MFMWCPQCRCPRVGERRIGVPSSAPVVSRRPSWAALVAGLGSVGALLVLTGALKLGPIEMLLLAALFAVGAWMITGLLGWTIHRKQRALALGALLAGLYLILTAVRLTVIWTLTSESDWQHIPGFFHPLQLLPLWAGALLLPWAGVTLWNASTTPEGKKETSRRPDLLKVALAVLSIAALQTGLILVQYFGSHATVTPRLDASSVVREVRDNVIIVDTQVIASEGSALVGFAMEGPDLSQDQLDRARRAVIGAGVAVIGPKAEPNPQVQGLLANLDRMSLAFAFPDGDSARQAAATIKGPVDLRLSPKDQVQARKEVFAIATEEGRVIRVTLFLGRPSLGQGAVIDPHGKITFTTDLVKVPPAQVPENDSEMFRLKKKLELLLTRAGERHPDVVRLRSAIRELQTPPATGSVSGIGVALQVKGGRFLVSKVFPGSPAASQLKEGDEILRVGDTVESLKEVDAMIIEQVVELIRGKEGSQVVLAVKSTEADAVERLVTLVRTNLTNATVGTAEVEGVLMGPDDQPLPREILIFVREGTSMDGANPGTICDGPTDAKGAFQFPLPVGQHWQVILARNGREVARSAPLTATDPSASPEPNYELRLKWNGRTLDAELRSVIPPVESASKAEQEGAPTPLQVVIEKEPLDADGSTQVTIRRIPIAPKLPEVRAEPGDTGTK